MSNNKTSNILCILLLLLVFLFFLNPIIYPLASADSGYFLSIAREFFNGKKYFIEIGTIYNPLAIFTIGFPFTFNSNPDLRYHILINSFIIFFCGIVFYNICLNFLSKKKWRLILSLMLIVLMFYNDGRYIILEPLSILFQLISLLVLFQFYKGLRSVYLFFIGFFIALSFLSKQFGLFIILPILISLFLENKINLRNIFLLFSGFISPLIFLYLFLNYNSNLHIAEYLKYILGLGFKLDVGNGTGIELDFYSKLLFLALVIISNFYTLLFPFYFRSIVKTKSAVIVISSLFASMTVLYFAFYLHYFLYVIPYFLMLMALVIDKNFENKNFKFYLFSMLGISYFFLLSNSLRAFVNRAEQLKLQNEMATKLNFVVPTNSKVYIDGISPSYYYSCNFRSIDSKFVSYSFPGYLNEATIAKYLNSGEYLILSLNKLSLYEKVLQKYTLKYLSIHGIQLVVIKKV
ncbi:hypothetical protein [Flavobacterium sp.]|jgi:hypothetical protein|uniref:ArnT family glycosyltransferase n=2 Tax=Flavobacterium sp. TaxID=239 RepID=UPI0022BF4AB4|nr:hypothetical protein [Flavobacterium sp.]MCZ8144146.1 hypothetical protein [Flavobacterium sp.]MCZ8366233.1 hypothetical protein [Flavobacterium sp.]